VELLDCYVETSVESATTYAGGLIGQINTSWRGSGTTTVTGCAFSGSVIGTDNVGGLSGSGTGLAITDCYVDGQITGARYVGGILGNKPSGGEVSISNSYTLASVRGTECVGGILGRQLTTDTGTFSVVGCRVLGEAVTREGLSTAMTLGALSGDARYQPAYYVQTDTFAWDGLTLGRKALAATTAVDSFFNPDRNGQGFLSWALRSEVGWPEALVGDDGAWSYTTGDLPVLVKFVDKMNSEFPAYMAGVPTNGTTGDKTELLAVIAQVEALQSADYSLEVAMWDEVQKKLAYAHQINDLYGASEAEIDAVIDALTDAVAELNRLNAITFTGDGTTDSPYEIADLDRLLKMDRLVNSTDITVREAYRAVHYKLTADINLSGVSWSPLGGNVSDTAFTGSFDGGGKTISNLALRGTTYLGFFGYTSGATIKNLTLKDFSIVGVANLAGIAAYSVSATTITDCNVSGTIIADRTEEYYDGGIVSRMDGGTISGCTAAVDMLDTSSIGMYSGGIAGYLASGTIENCSVSNYSIGGAITGRNAYVGGIVGNINSAQNLSTIKNCSVKANLAGQHAGGIVGYGTSSGTNPDRIVISGCYFDGMISSANTAVAANLGGIAGVLLNNFKITDCRSDGTITAAAIAGGILGRFSGILAGNVAITNCYTTMRIGNGLVVGGIVGNTNVTTNTGKLVITNSFALNEQVGGATTANAIHAFGEENVKLDYTLEGVKAWDEMRIRTDGEAQAAPSGSSAVSYADLQLAATWPAAFKDSGGPWTFTAGKLPVLTGLSGVMTGDFPAYMTNPAERPDLADTKELLTLINSADALSKVAYLQDTWEKMAEALVAAKIVLYNDRAAQDEVDAVREALQTAIDSLEFYREITTLEGEGTAELPYLIGNADDYVEMSRLLDIPGTDIYREAYYKLTNDIDLRGALRSPMPYTTATSYSLAASFSGDFDGGGFTISNLTVTHPDHTGMFSYVYGARIHDLTLENCDVSASGSCTGAIAGFATYSEFENIYVTGRVVGSANLGGIVGTGSSTLKNCHFEGTVETGPASAFWIGGIAGNFSGSIEDCSFKGALTYNGAEALGAYMGGIVGTFAGEDIKGCYVEADILYKYNGGGTVNPGANAGGIVGRFDGKNIVDCHFKGKIDTRGENIGGIVGLFLEGFSIVGCTSEGEINMNFPNGESSGKPAGGIVGTIATGGGYGWTGRAVLIDDCTTYMSITGFRGAGGIGGVVTGSGSLTISNSKALNKALNNSASYFYVDPFLFGESWYASEAFTGTLTLENNYIWEGMLINGMTLTEWLKQTYNEDKFDGSNGVWTLPTQPPPSDGNDDNPSNPPTSSNSSNPNNVSPNTATGDGSSITGVGIATEVASGTAIDNRPTSAQSNQSQNTNTPNVDTPITEPTTPEAAEPTPARTPTFFEIVVETVQNNPVIVVALIVAAGVLAMLGGLWRYRKTRRE
jgi:hypothetical protein